MAKQVFPKRKKCEKNFSFIPSKKPSKKAIIKGEMEVKIGGWIYCAVTESARLDA